MTEHSPEELKRQWDQAKSQLGQAQAKETAARKRYQDSLVRARLAKLAAQGFEPGSIVRVWMKLYSGEEEDIGCFGFAGVEYRYSRLSNGRPEIILTRLKKGGTPGKTRVYVWGPITRMELVSSPSEIKRQSK